MHGEIGPHAPNYMSAQTRPYNMKCTLLLFESNSALTQMCSLRYHSSPLPVQYFARGSGLWALLLTEDGELQLRVRDTIMKLERRPNASRNTY